MATVCVEAELNELNHSMDFIVQCASFSIESVNIAEKQVLAKTEMKLWSLLPGGMVFYTWNIKSGEVEGHRMVKESNCNRKILEDN